MDFDFDAWLMGNLRNRKDALAYLDAHLPADSDVLSYNKRAELAMALVQVARAHGIALLLVDGLEGGQRGPIG